MSTRDVLTLQARIQDEGISDSEYLVLNQGSTWSNSDSDISQVFTNMFTLSTTAKHSAN